MRFRKKNKVKEVEQERPSIELSKEFVATVDEYESTRSKKIKRYIFKPLKIITFTLTLAILSLIFVVIFTGLAIYIKYTHEFENIKPRSNSTQLIMYDRANNIIYKGFGAAEPQEVPLSEMPDMVKKSTLAAEDLDFYKHGPIDFKGIVRALYNNWQQSNKSGWQKLTDLLQADSYTQGGSTITQQLVKNIYLSQDKSFERKIKEVVYSYNLEHKYTKDQILEMYLNEIYYGEQALGIKNAAKIYFDKDLKDLTLPEASMLAGLPQAPTEYSPLGDNYDESKKRQEYVLQRMYLASDIDLETAKSAANTELYFSGKQETIDKYPFFSQYVKDDLQKQTGSSDIDNSGYRVYTSLDPVKQEIAERQAKEGIKKLSYRGATNAAVVIADPKTNEVLAMVGGVDWDKSKVNVATSERQPGSSFKPVVYSAALENGYTAATILNDKYVNFGGNPAYIPKNYSGGYSGFVTVRNALARSLNIPAVEMGKLVGVEKVIDMAHSLGISTINRDATSYGLSISLGSAEVKLADMTEVYSTFAAGGERMPQTAISKILDSKGNKITLIRRNKQRVMSSESAYIISSILSDNNARSATFGSVSPLKTDKLTAVKTGTTDDYADSWTMGYTPDLVVGVWMGNNDRTPMRRVSGIEGAAYIWHDIMTECLKDIPSKDFERPTTIKEAWINPYTGAISKYQARPSVLEYFKPGTEPGTKTDLSYLKQF
ncbi:MAG: PBP1A family penicillin-binding protein [Patescibacteria group bacterium]|nr:PBP1A family penicillin-binding protein [Patescibacteria group bacterium]